LEEEIKCRFTKSYFKDGENNGENDGRIESLGENIEELIRAKKVPS